MAPRNPAPAGALELKDIVMSLQTRVEGLIASERRSEDRIATLENELKARREHDDEVQMHCIALQLQLDDVGTDTDHLLQVEAERAARGYSSDSSSSNSSISLFDRVEQAERQIKAAMGDPELKRAIAMSFCRKMDISKLSAKHLPAYVNQNTADAPDGAADDAADDKPLRFDWYLSEHEPVNSNAIFELTTFVITYGSTLHALAVRPLFTVKREGVKALVTKKFKALAKTYRDYHLVQDHEHEKDEVMRQAEARMNGADNDAPAGDEPMAVDPIKEQRAVKVKERTDRKNAISRNQTAQKYAARYRNLLREYLPDGDAAKKPENDIAFVYQTQSPWVSDDDKANPNGKKVVTRKWESEAFQAVKRLEERTDIKISNPKDAKKLQAMKKARRLPVLADDESDSDDVQHIRDPLKRVERWMVDDEFFERHPGTVVHLRVPQTTNGQT
ncbi:hypothetical protein AURDEDRAFT_174698 [Auricularia subglabra TFB-10046 SS5]|nr:hypothetical protein AURDEDRAFT_174698 [Auricularia subglabra TFB-10046 SS5]